MEACFLPTNPAVGFTPLGYTWGPLKQKSGVTSTSGDQHVTFVQGLKTIGGHGDATLKEGLAVHQYAFNTDMHRQAFVNHDGDMLLVPQQGTLDIKTELGNLLVKPGVIAVLPAGIRFSVRIVRNLPGSASGDQTPVHEATGYALEVFGTHYALPDLGVLGANGLAHVHDFEYPVAAFDLEPPNLPPWQVTIKLAGKLFAYTQGHTPFDVVAWHGKYAPYRYELSRFGHLTANVDQLDPTAYCVLTAPSKWPGVSLVDFCVFGEKWAVAQDTLRIPYYHRTMATELGGVIQGQYLGSVKPLEAGGLSFEQSYMPHGESYESYVRARDATLEPAKVSTGYLGKSLSSLHLSVVIKWRLTRTFKGFMFHVSSHLALTKWAMEDHPDIRCK